MSTNFIYPDLTADKRVKMLAKQCLRTETTTYSRTLSDDEISAENHAYAREGITLAAIEKEKKEVLAKFAAQIKGVKSIMEQRLKIINNGKKEIEGKLFLFADQKTGDMRYFDKYGECVMTRKLRPEEKATQLYIGDNTDQITQGVGNDAETVDTEHVEVQAEETGKKKKETAKEKKARLAKEAKEVRETPEPVTEKEVKKPAKDKKPTPADVKGEDLTDKVAKMSKSRKATKKRIDDEAAGQEAGVTVPVQDVADQVFPEDTGYQEAEGLAGLSEDDLQSLDENGENEDY